MVVLEGVALQVLQATEFITIVTQGEEVPHLVATWGDYIRALGIENDTVMVPAGHLMQTEQNIRRNPHVQILAASRQVPGSYGPGQGCLYTGTAVFFTEGDQYMTIHEKYPWARGVMVVHIDTATAQL